MVEYCRKLRLRPLAQDLISPRVLHAAIFWLRCGIGGVVCWVGLPYGKQRLKADAGGYSPFSL